MAKKKTKIINGPLQKKIIIRGLPFGVYCEKYMRGEKESKTKSIRKSFHKLLERGTFQLIPMSTKGVLKRVKRCLLAKEVLPDVIHSACPEHLAKHIPFGKKITVRGDEYHRDALSRLVRNADTQNFLYSCDVDNPFSALVNYNANPFLFGAPNVEGEIEGADTVSLFAALTSAMCKTVAENSLPSILDVTNVHSFYCPNRYNEQAKKVNVSEKKNIARAYNNSIGILIDFANKYGYMIFKFPLSKNVTWYPKAYVSAMNNMGTVTKSIGIQNVVFGSQLIDTAIILCETDTEYKAVIKRFSGLPEIGEFFYNILPIMMTEEGIQDIKSLLNMGINKYLQAYDDRMFNSAKMELRKSGPIFLTSDGREYFNGAYVNLKTLNRIKKNQEIIPESEWHEYILCPNNMIELYCSIAGIDEKLIVTY